MLFFGARIKVPRMKISGFTIIKNAEINDYPIIEAIRSILPVVDEMVVLAGDSSDNTRALIQNIGDPKIKLFDSVWDPTLRSGGSVLAVETNKALQLIDPESDWAFYIQGDEVIHEADHPKILEACSKYKNDKNVEGLVFKYIHFYATYDYVADSRKWYPYEVRIIRNKKEIASYKDAQGFRVGKRKLNAKHIPAAVYHYGWVKSPAQMKKKLDNSAKLWHDDTSLQKLVDAGDVFDFNDFNSIQLFKGSHPAVMEARIRKAGWNIKLDVNKKNFSLKERVLYFFQKKFGLRPFSFKNYRIS